jgi:small-conductance mechanosensitive channel
VQVVAALLALQFGLSTFATAGAWRATVLHGVWLAFIAASAWLVATLLLVVADVALLRFRTDVEDNRHARRVHTQVTVIRRVTVAVVVVLAVGAMLVTFPSARAAGASVLASAGVAGVIAGLAAQSVLGNVLAGLQIAFGDSLRLDDVVVEEGEWGRIEEITLSYVAVHIWDDRRLVLPTSYFTTKPFQNWTRTESALLGTVELDVDWSVPMEQLRQELERVLAAMALWDGRVAVVQVTDAVGPFIRVRVLVSAADAPTLWDLRCVVRERLVTWMQAHHPDALPRMRADLGRGADHPPATPVTGAEQETEALVFGGGADGRDRSDAFTGPHDESPVNGTTRARVDGVRSVSENG